ncbi:MAG: hypothetical protein V3U09_07765, partial [Thermoplasmata archaeon]
MATERTIGTRFPKSVSSQLVLLCVGLILCLMTSNQGAQATAWGPEQDISTDVWMEAQGYPSIAVDGDVVHVVWEDYEDFDSDIYYRQFNGTSWLAIQ